MVAYRRALAEGSWAVLPRPQLAHPGGEQAAWGHPGSAMLCQAGLPARGTDSLVSSRSRERRLKGIFSFTHSSSLPPA